MPSAPALRFCLALKRSGTSTQPSRDNPTRQTRLAHSSPGPAQPGTPLPTVPLPLSPHTLAATTPTHSAPLSFPSPSLRQHSSHSSLSLSSSPTTSTASATANLSLRHATDALTNNTQNPALRSSHNKPLHSPLSYPDPHGQGATWPSRLARHTARSRARHAHCSQPTRLHDGNLLFHSRFSSQDNITHIPHQGTPPNLIFSPCRGEI